MDRFLLSRRWLLAHILIVAVVGTCVSLGLWQLRRLEERRTRNRLTVARLQLPAADAGTLLAAPGEASVSSYAYRRVELRGAYDPDRELSLYGRSLDGRPGTHVLTPLVTEEGTALIVDRGWMPLKGGAEPVGQAGPPREEVRVGGILLPSEGAARLGPRKPSGQARVITRIDLELLGRELPYRVYPLYVLLQDQEPPQPSRLPRPVELPPRGEGPHLGYALQWFSFGVVALVGYAVVVRRAVKERVRRPGKAPLPA